MGAENLFNARSNSITITSTGGVASASTALPAIGTSLRIVSSGGGTYGYIALADTNTAAAVVADATPRMNATPFLIGSDITLEIPQTQQYASIIGEAGQTIKAVVQVAEGQ